MDTDVYTLATAYFSAQQQASLMTVVPDSPRAPRSLVVMNTQSAKEEESGRNKKETTSYENNLIHNFVYSNALGDDEKRTFFEERRRAVACNFFDKIEKIYLNGTDKNVPRSICKSCGSSQNGIKFETLLVESKGIPPKAETRNVKGTISWNEETTPQALDIYNLFKRVDDVEELLAKTNEQLCTKGNAITMQGLEITALKKQLEKRGQSKLHFSAPPIMSPFTDKETMNQPAADNPSISWAESTRIMQGVTRTPEIPPPSPSNIVLQPATPAKGMLDAQEGTASQQKTPKTWAQIAMAQELRPAMKDRLRATKEVLRTANLAPTRRIAAKPNKVAPYFPNVRKGPIGEHRRILTRFLPGWAVLSLSFICRSTADIFTHALSQRPLITSMKLSGYTHLTDYDLSNPFSN